MTVQFSGSSYYQYPANGFPLAQAAKSICFWLSLSDNASLQSIFNAIDTTAGVGYQIGVRSSALNVWSYGGTALLSVTPPAVNSLTHVTYTFDATTHSILLNGVLAGTSTAAPQSGQPSLCQIGGNQWSENLLSGGQIEDLRLYNRVLSTNEILTVMNCSTMDMIVQGLVARWAMSELQAGLALDATVGIKEDYGLQCTYSGTAAAAAKDSIKMQRRIP